MPPPVCTVFVCKFGDVSFEAKRRNVKERALTMSKETKLSDVDFPLKSWPLHPFSQEMISSTNARKSV